jgi:broad specificity phosphatase PhoE
MEIILARHGEPALRQRSWIAPRQIAGWIQAYNHAGIVDEDAPLKVCAKAAQSRVIVSSPWPRCLESARAVAPRRDIFSEDTLREAELPYSSWVFPRLPLTVWTVLFRLGWFCGYSTNSEPFAAARGRARSAAARLIEFAREHQAVFVIGHGVMNAMIARDLQRQGWIGPKRTAHGYWQFSVYRKSAP